MTSTPPVHESIHIREACRSDVHTLAPLFQQEAELAQCQASYYELEPDFDWVAWAQANIASKKRLILLAEQGSQALGFAHLRIVTYGSQQPPKSRLHRLLRSKQSRPLQPLKPISYGVIEACFVAPAFRRNGIGNRLVKHALEQLTSKGIQHVELGVLTDNAEAQQFWQQLGFETFRVLMQRNINRFNHDI